MYVDLAGFATRLTDNLSWKAPFFSIPEEDYEHLLDWLEDEDYSFLQIRDGNAIEVVRVINVCDRIVIQRGAELTRPLAFRCGAHVSFVITKTGIEDKVCQMDNCEDS